MNIVSGKTLLQGVVDRKQIEVLDNARFYCIKGGEYVVVSSRNLVQTEVGKSRQTPLTEDLMGPNVARIQ